MPYADNLTTCRWPQCDKLQPQIGCFGCGYAAPRVQVHKHRPGPAENHEPKDAQRLLILTYFSSRSLLQDTFHSLTSFPHIPKHRLRSRSLPTFEVGPCLRPVCSVLRHVMLSEAKHLATDLKLNPPPLDPCLLSK